MSETSPQPTSPFVELAELASQLEAVGQQEYADRLRAATARLRTGDQEFRGRVSEVLAIHHEMNNALTGVLGNAQLLQMSPAAGDESVKKRLDSLTHEAERIRKITADLREFRRRLQEDQPDSSPIKEAS